MAPCPGRLFITLEKVGGLDHPLSPSYPHSCLLLDGIPIALCSGSLQGVGGLHCKPVFVLFCFVFPILKERGGGAQPPTLPVLAIPRTCKSEKDTTENDHLATNLDCLAWTFFFPSDFEARKHMFLDLSLK